MLALRLQHLISRTMTMVAFGIVAASCGTDSVVAPPNGTVVPTMVPGFDLIDDADKPYNFDAWLIASAGSPGWGTIEFRQPVDADVNAFLHTRIEGLAPNTSYQLQRATDGVLDGICTGTNWLTLGHGTLPQDIVTDGHGSGEALLFRNLAAALGSTFDIRFRVLNAATSAVVLVSGCRRFTVRQ